MSLENFEGDCFVAFIDISGFKNYMKENKALDALDVFYNSGYDELQQSHEVCGIFVSDCGILFTKGGEKKRQLENILTIIKNINNKMLDNNYMLTTSIAYGHFCYMNRLECANIQKNSLFGNAYLEAFLDNEKGKIKIYPGQCRIKKKYLEDITLNNMHYNDYLVSKDYYYYFYWNLNNPDDINSFENDYNDSYNRMYGGMKSALKKHRRNNSENNW